MNALEVIQMIGLVVGAMTLKNFIDISFMKNVLLYL